MVSGGRATTLAGTVASTRPPHGDAAAPYVTLLRTLLTFFSVGQERRVGGRSRSS
jgi:hypothetical protein